MTTPKVVTAWTELNWISIDDQVWFAGVVLDPAVALADILAAHNDPATGEQCKHSPASIALHTVVSRDPLTITPSLACGACKWHGFVTAGKWVPA